MNEAYRKDTGLPSPTEELLHCPMSGCNKNGTQCVEVSQPVVLTPSATVGTPTLSCQGTPTVTCETNAAHTACTVTLTQSVCVTVPVQYGVTMTAGEASIACEHGSCPCC
jgi:hypothetical protein